MRRAGSGWMPVMLLLAIAALSFWLERSVQGERSGAAPKKNAPDFWAEAFTLRNFDAQGEPLHTIRAQRMVHYADRDIVELSTPQLHLRRDGVAIVNAERGLLGPKGERIDLHDRVVVERRPSGADAVISVMRTEHLIVFPDSNRASAPGKVTIERPGMRVSGNGLESDQGSGISTLQGRVRVLMEPRRSS